MKRFSPVVLSLLYGTVTFANAFLWVLFPNLAHYIGAASVTQTFVFAIGIGNKYLFIFILIMLFAFILCLVIAIYLAYKKHVFNLLLLMMRSDVIISTCILIYKLFVQNYASIYHLVIGALFRSLFVIYFSQVLKTYNS